ncbi:MAG TPA: DNA translocase FtsK [Dehalococcoidia bacterium]|nr:DNA translocase FtsK [Dehalococcoidia bacterium]
MDRKTPGFREVHKEMDKGRSRKISRWDWILWSVIAIAIVTLTVLMIWFGLWEPVSTIAVDIWDILGWGVVIIATVLLTLVGLGWGHRLSLLLRYWNQSLGGLGILMGGWGILALFDFGGSFGLDIIGRSEAIAYLRIIGIFFVSIVVIAPEVGYFVFIKPVRWLIRRSPRPKAPALTRRSKQPAPDIKPDLLDGDVTIQDKAVTPATKVQPKTTVVPVPADHESQRGLRQVAQDVWKKYGESSTTVIVDGWRLPPIDILDKMNEVEFGESDNVQRAQLIEESLASYGVEVKVVQINTGPTVTQFGVEPGWDRKKKEVREKDKDGNIRVQTKEVSKTRVKVDRITSLANDLALALAAPSLRIEAPVPGKSVVGIEVPNVITSAVSLRSVIETSNFQKIRGKSTLAMALGKGAGGEAGAGDLAKMPHLLIAGATGSGKTVCLNSSICCLLMNNTPNELRLIMIDPKRVELTPFNSIPHLAVPVIVDTDKALDVLRWLNVEMDRRYQQLAKATARNIDSYNKSRQGKDRLPYLVLVIDELADLMMAGFDEVEHILCRLAQLSRAVGIHLIVATQRPSVDVVTGLIKANFPTRISFAVTSQVDSRTILDGAGAEKLLGRGDMLYMPTEAAKPKRLQGCFVSDAETERLVYFWGSQKSDQMAALRIEEALSSPAMTRIREAPKDALLEAAKQLASEHENISTSFLQRRLQIGYPRAARLKEQLTEALSVSEEQEIPEEEEEITD